MKDGIHIFSGGNLEIFKNDAILVIIMVEKISKNKLTTLKKIAKQAMNCSTFHYKVGAVIFKNGRILSTGYNVKSKNSAIARKYFKHSSLHAETMAILQLIHHPKLLEGAEIFVYRESCSGDIKMSKPCGMCLLSLQEVGIKKAYWSTNEYPFFDFDKIDVLCDQLDSRQIFHTNGK